MRALLPRLRDPTYAKMLLVTLAEATPVLEAGTRHTLLGARARLEVPHIQRVADELAREAWLIPWSA